MTTTITKNFSLYLYTYHTLFDHKCHKIKTQWNNKTQHLHSFITQYWYSKPCTSAWRTGRIVYWVFFSFKRVNSVVFSNLNITSKHHMHIHGNKQNKFNSPLNTLSGRPRDSRLSRPLWRHYKLRLSAALGNFMNKLSWGFREFVVVLSRKRKT